MGLSLLETEERLWLLKWYLLMGVKYGLCSWEEAFLLDCLGGTTGIFPLLFVFPSLLLLPLSAIGNVACFHGIDSPTLKENWQPVICLLPVVGVLNTVDILWTVPC